MFDITDSRLVRQRTGAGVGLVGSLLVAGAIALILVETTPGERAISAIVHASGIALPIGLGLFRLSRRASDRFAWLLVATGLLWSLTTLAESSNPTLYSVGRTAAWLVEPALVYLMLAFPTGRLAAATERRLTVAATSVAAVLYLPSILLAPFPEPSPWATCGSSCPANAFALTDGNPAWIADFVRPVREVLITTVFAGVAVVLLQRTRRAASLTRKVLAPVAAVGIYRALALISYQGLRSAGVESTALEVVGWLYVMTLPLIALAFAAGLLRQRLFVADALERVTVGLRDHSDAGVLRAALAGALGDPTLTIVYWLPGEQGRWVDEAGWPIKAPKPERGRAVTEITTDGRRLAAIVHDGGLDPLVVRAAGAHALTTLENERLLGQLHTSLDELAGSRARIAAVADRERRKIERDLHDGAQQRLVALRIKLELVAERIEEQSPESAADIRRLEGDVESTIDEVRSFARGIYPPLLAQRGLGEALRAAGRGSPIPTTVDAEAVTRHAPEIEATVYFACMEALQNAVKHAHGATGVVITLTENPRLRFEVRDDGAGFVVPTVPNGNGLTNLRDRMAAVGGEVDVRSEIGRGTVVTGVVSV